MKWYTSTIILTTLTCVVFMAGIISCSSTIEITDKPDNSNNRVTTVSFGHFNIYFIKTDTGYILVDTGMPKKEEELDKAFVQAGVKPGSVTLIIITHAHPDHVGSVAYAKEITGAKVLCDRYAASFIRSGTSSPIVPRNIKGKIINTISPKWKYQGIEPDILVNKKYSLNEFGIHGQVVQTSGHTQGSLVIVLDTGEMIVGDLVRGKPENINLGMFYENKDDLVQSLEHLLSYNVRKIYMSHGGSIDYITYKNALTKIKG